MNARIHQGLAWIFVAAIAGITGCSASDGSGKPASGTGKPAPGAPGGTAKPEPGAPGGAAKPPPGRPGPGRPGGIGNTAPGGTGNTAPGGAGNTTPGGTGNTTPGGAGTPGGSGGTGNPEQGGAGTPAPVGQGPANERPGGMPSECFGPSALTPAARELFAVQVCGPQGRSVATSSSATQGSACASAYQMGSDTQIAGLLSAWNEAVIRESTAAAGNAADPGVRDVAHLLMVTSMRARDEQGALFGRLAITPEQTPGSRALDSGYQAEGGAIQAGASFGREYVMRQIEAEQRALQLFDALVPQAHDAELRGALQTARIVTEAQLEHACWVLASTATCEEANGGAARNVDQTAAATGDAGRP